MGKLIKKYNLINFWCFSENTLKTIFKTNYKFVFYFYQFNILLNYDLFFSMIKKIFPFFNFTNNNNENFLFIGIKCLYLQSITNTSNLLINHISSLNIGTFTNFSNFGFNVFDNFKLLKNTGLIIFFQPLKDNYLVLESKKKNIPSFGLIHSSTNSCLVDYPFFLNSFYFYNIYILSRIFFYYIIKLI